MIDRTFRCPECDATTSVQTNASGRGPMCSSCSLEMLDVAELEEFWCEVLGQVDDGSEGDQTVG